jgi:hypothetical protein
MPLKKYDWEGMSVADFCARAELIGTWVRNIDCLIGLVFVGQA